MIVYVIYVLRIAIGKSKNNAPIGLNRDGMQPRQDSPQFAGMIGPHAPRAVIFEQAFQTLVTYRADHSLM